MKEQRGSALVLSKVCPIMYEKYSDYAYVQVPCTEAYGMSPQALQDNLLIQYPNVYNYVGVHYSVIAHSWFVLTSLM